MIQDADDTVNDLEYVSFCLEQAFVNYNIRPDNIEEPLKQIERARNRYQNSPIFDNILANPGIGWAKEIRYLELEFMCMEACILRIKDPKKALALIKEARHLYQEYEINSVLPAIKFEMVEMSLEAVAFEQQG